MQHLDFVLWMLLYPIMAKFHNEKSKPSLFEDVAKVIMHLGIGYYLWRY